MESTKDFLDPQILADINGLSLRARHVVDGFLSGKHRNSRPGSSTEYSQHRPYVPGDDLRRVDWKAFGRTDRLYVKQYLDETNLACSFLLDASGSMGYRGAASRLSKYQYSCCLVASLSWLLHGQGDAVGLGVCRSDRPEFLPAAASEFQLREIVDILEKTEPDAGTDLAGSVRHWATRSGNRQVVVIVSDLFGGSEQDEERFLSILIDLRQFGHEVVVFQVCDREEVDFPFEQYSEFSPVEAGDPITLDPAVFRSGYLREFREYQNRIRQACQRAEIDFVPLVTDESIGKALARFLAIRSHHVYGAG